MPKPKEFFPSISYKIPILLQFILNISLVLLGIFLSFLLFRELFLFTDIFLVEDYHDYNESLESILIFFLYFEFISMIVKYFKEEYHFPLRYFMYIGITAMIRLIIVDHHSPIDTLLFSLIILVLIIGFYIINITPRERPGKK